MAREGPGPGVVAEAARHGRGTAHSAGPRGLPQALSRRAWAAPLWSPANEAAYGTGGKTRACAASAPRHLRPASRPASSPRRVPAPTAACLLGPPGEALSGSGAFLLHGASLPGRGLRNGPGSLNDVRVAAEPPPLVSP